MPSKSNGKLLTAGFYKPHTFSLIATLSQKKISGINVWLPLEAHDFCAFVEIEPSAMLVIGRFKEVREFYKLLCRAKRISDVPRAKRLEKLIFGCTETIKSEKITIRMNVDLSAAEFTAIPQPHQ